MGTITPALIGEHDRGEWRARKRGKKEEEEEEEEDEDKDKEESSLCAGDGFSNCHGVLT